jgi:hypothetical protein
MEGEGMDSKFKLVLITAALFVVIGSGVHVASANPPVAQTQQNKTTPSGTDNNKTASAPDCSLLTPTMLEKTIGDSFRADTPQKALPMYGGASGWSCSYHGTSPGGVRVDFAIYAEESAAKAKQDFDKYSIAADNSKEKPSIGDSAYWVAPTKITLSIFVLKGKIHFSISMHPGNEKQLKDLASTVAARI